MTPLEPRKGINPAWSNLPRRKCDDCGKSYKPVRPVKKDERGFCAPNCRKSYHKHGGAYRKLRVEVRKMVEKEFAAMRQEMKDYIRSMEVSRMIAHVANQSEATAAPLPNPRHPR